MNKKLLASLGLIVATAATPAAAAEQWPNWYLGLTGAVTFVPESDIDGTFNGDLDYDSGYGLGASLGYAPAMDIPFRFEGEITYRKNDTDTVTIGGVSSSATHDISSVAYMFNAFYDFAAGYAVTPYVGLGIGGAQVNLDTASGVGNTGDEDHVFAYQAMVGISYSPEAMPFTDWSLGYRYFGTDTPEFEAGAGSVEVDYDVHSVEAGARFRF